jgi:hypothetical protein
MKTTEIEKFVEPSAFLTQAVAANTVKSMEALLKQLPIVDESDYSFDLREPGSGWKQDKFHWIPLGKERNNAGRINLASRPENPIAERTINAMEALIELERRKELVKNPSATAPKSPREAVMRYFSLPPLDSLPRMKELIKGQKAREYAREIAKRIRVKASFDKTEREFAVYIEDEGIGQAPERIHETLLSLSSSDKGDKPYLIGMFGQGGSSTYAASGLSWCVSRRAPGLSESESDGIGWTAVKKVYPKDRRDPYYAYLAANPSGNVPALPAQAAEAIGLKHGSRFAHLGYNFAGNGSAVMRSLYYMLNHILYNPVLPFDSNAGGTEATIYGNGYRLTNAAVEQKTSLDKSIPSVPV